MNTKEGLRVAVDSRGFSTPLNNIILGGPTLGEIIDRSLEYADGVHLFPMEGNAYEDFKHGKQEGIISTEQPFRSETSLWPVIEHLTKPKEAAMLAASYVLFPERVEGLQPMYRYQSDVHEQLNVVIYPYHGIAKRNGEEWNSIMIEHQYDLFDYFYNPIIRLQPELIDRFGVNSIQELDDEITKLGYKGFSLNMHHLLRPATQGFQTTFHDIGNVHEIIDYVVSRAEVLEFYPSLPDAATNHSRPWIHDTYQQFMLERAAAHQYDNQVVVTFPFGQLNKSHVDVHGFIQDLMGQIHSDTRTQ